MNIYITRTNEEKLREVNDYTMSGLINHLLTEYFRTHGLPSMKGQLPLTKKEVVSVIKETEEIKRNQDQ